MLFKTLLAGVCCTFASLFAYAGTGIESKTDHTTRSEVNGNVFHADNHKPVRDVTITAYSASRKEMAVVTDAAGNYTFDGLKTGTYRFVFERQGYRKVVREKVAVRSDEGVQLNIGMAEEDEFNWMPGLLPMLAGE